MQPAQALAIVMKGFADRRSPKPFETADGCDLEDQGLEDATLDFREGLTQEVKRETGPSLGDQGSACKA